MFKGGRLFDLRQNAGPVADKSARIAYVLRRLNEAQGDEIDIVLKRKSQILAVFLGERRDRNSARRHIDALVARELTAEIDLGFNDALVLADDGDLHSPIVELQDVARL